MSAPAFPYPCGNEDHCSSRAFCNGQGVCECFSDWGTAGLPDCTTTTTRSVILLAVYVPSLLFLVRYLFVHLQLLTQYEMKEKGLSRRKLFHLLSLANLGAICLEYSIYVAYAMGKLHIRRLSRSPNCLDSILVSISSLTLVGWQLLIANIWYEAAQESGIYQPRTCIGRNIVRILMAFGLLLGVVCGVASIATGQPQIFGPFALVSCTVVALSYNFAVKAVLRGYLSALTQGVGKWRTPQVEPSTPPPPLSQAQSPEPLALPDAVAPTIAVHAPSGSLQQDVVAHEVSGQGSLQSEHLEDDGDEPLAGSLADLSRRPMLATSLSLSVRRLLATTELSATATMRTVKEEEDEGEGEEVRQQQQQQAVAGMSSKDQAQQQVGSKAAEAALSSVSLPPPLPSPATLSQLQQSVSYAERRRQRVHNEVVRLALTLTLLALVPAVTWTAPIKDPYALQFAILVGVLAYAAANLACLFHLSPRFRKTAMLRCRCLGWQQLPDQRVVMIQRRLKRQPV